MHVFITGISGLVGSAVARRAVAMGHTVSGLTRSATFPANLVSIKESVKLYEGDILDVLSLEEPVKNADLIVHAAAMVSFLPKDRQAMFDINVRGTAQLVNECLRHENKTFCFISSVAALGKPIKPKNQQITSINENQKWVDEAENSFYGKTKFLAECEVWRAEAEGLNTMVLNPSVVIGESYLKQSSSKLFDYIKKGRKFYTDGLINYVDAEDLSLALFDIYDKKAYNSRFILNAGTISYNSFFEMLATKMNKKAPNIKLGKLWIAVLWRLEYLRSILTGAQPLISKETSQSAASFYTYDATKVQNLGFNFRSLEESLDRISKFYNGI
jgi:dihydroflavonol-4-reductase